MSFMGFHGWKDNNGPLHTSVHWHLRPYWLTDWKDQIKLHCDSDMDQFKDKQVYLSEPRTKRCFYGHIRVGMRSTRWKNMSWSKHVNRLFKQAFMKSNENLHLVVVLRGCLFTMRDFFFFCTNVFWLFKGDFEGGFFLSTPFSIYFPV